MDPVSAASGIIAIAKEIYNIRKEIAETEEDLAHLCDTFNIVDKTLTALLSNEKLKHSEDSLNSMLQLTMNIKKFIDKNTKKKKMVDNVYRILMRKDISADCIKFSQKLNQGLVLLTFTTSIDNKEDLKKQFASEVDRVIQDFRYSNMMLAESRRAVEDPVFSEIPKGRGWFEILLEMLGKYFSNPQWGQHWAQNIDFTSLTMNDLKSDSPIVEIFYDEVKSTIAEVQDPEQFDEYYSSEVSCEIEHEFSYYATGFRNCLGPVVDWISHRKSVDTKKLNEDMVRSFNKCIYAEIGKIYNEFHRFDNKPTSLFYNYVSADKQMITRLEMTDFSHEFIPGMFANMTHFSMKLVIKQKKFESPTSLILWCCEQRIRLEEEE